MEVITDIYKVHEDFGKPGRFNRNTIYVKWGSGVYKTRFAETCFYEKIDPDTHQVIWNLSEVSDPQKALSNPRYSQDLFLGIITGLKLKEGPKHIRSSGVPSLNDNSDITVSSPTGDAAFAVNKDGFAAATKSGELGISGRSTHLDGDLNVTEPINKGITADLDIARFFPNGTLPITPFINDEVPTLPGVRKIVQTFQNMATAVKALKEIK